MRSRANILKRLVVHSGTANLGLLISKLLGKGTPRGLAGTYQLLFRLRALLSDSRLSSDVGQKIRRLPGPFLPGSNDYRSGMKTASFTTYCQVVCAMQLGASLRYVSGLLIIGLYPDQRTIVLVS